MGIKITKKTAEKEKKAEEGKKTFFKSANRKFANFWHLPVRKSQICEFVWLKRKVQICKFLQNTEQTCLMVVFLHDFYYVQILTGAFYAIQYCKGLA
jgi:hypothetical protein